MNANEKSERALNEADIIRCKHTEVYIQNLRDSTKKGVQCQEEILSLRSTVAQQREMTSELVEGLKNARWALGNYNPNSDLLGKLDSILTKAEIHLARME